MAITVRRVRRIEAWSTWKAAGGTRQAVVDDALSCTVTARLEDEQLLVSVPLTSAAAASLGARKLLRLDQDDTTYDEYRIIDRARDEEQARLVITAAPLRTTDLQGAGLIQRVDSDGVVIHDFESLGLTATEHIDNWILPALAAAGFGWIARGTVTPTQRVDMTFAWDTPLAALLRLATATTSELDIRRNGDAGYFIDLVARVNAAAQTADIRVDKNLVNVTSDESALEQATRVFPRGAAQDELQASMARATWLVTNVVGSVVTLADPAGGKGPIQYDNQLCSVNQTAYLRKPNGTLTQVTSSSATNQTVTVASATAIAIGDMIQFRANATGHDLVFLENPAAATAYGVKAGVKDVADVPGTNNLVKNSVMRLWPGSSSAPPTNWTAVGAPTIDRQTAAPFTAIGGNSIKVTSTADGQGVISDAVPIFPSALAPYLSGFAKLWVASGNARVELVISTPSGTKVFPMLPDVASASVLGQWADVGASGYDANGVAATTAQIRVVQNGTTASVFYIDAAQITESGTQQPFFEGSGGTRLWQEANEALRVRSNPLASYSVPLVDLETVDPVVWSESALILGADAHIIDAALGLDIFTRIVAINRDYLNPQGTSITLSNRFEDLTDILAGGVRPSRATPIVEEEGSTGGALVAPAITLTEQIVGGPPRLTLYRLLISFIPPVHSAYDHMEFEIISDNAGDVSATAVSSRASPVVVPVQPGVTYTAKPYVVSVTGTRTAGTEQALAITDTLHVGPTRLVLPVGVDLWAT